jgi:UDP-N-acetyl-D-mannosaminuronate dehydrogenase
MMAPRGHLVIGKGEVGSALVEILDADWIDLHDRSISLPQPEYVHIAVPYSEQFDGVVRRHAGEHPQALMVVHSTVPVGTCERLGVVHSPCRGMHPNLAEGIRTFMKFFGGARAEEAAKPFRALGIECRTVESSRNTEAMKLWETAQYGVFIRLMQEIREYCADHGLDFDVVYRQANETYNAGYQALGLGWCTRPVLQYQGPGIGGHCVMANARMLDSKSASDLQAGKRLHSVAGKG